MNHSQPGQRPTPPSVGKLEKYVFAYANAHGLAVGRVRHWVSFMMLSGVLDRASSTLGGAQFIIKGGVALELRLPGRARATDDLDIVVTCADDDVVSALDTALRTPYLDCTFRRKAEVYALGDKAVRVWVQIEYRSQRWATVQIDLAHPEYLEVETERVNAIPLEYFGLTGPHDVTCLSLRYHIAQKFHGMTQIPPDGRQNERFRDALDLLLLRDLVEDDAAVREACEETFRIRNTHTWPPVIALPESWDAPFAAMVANTELSIRNLPEAEQALREFLGQLLATNTPETDSKELDEGVSR